MVDVAEALRHLLALGVDDEPVVRPVVGERVAERDGLGALVLVVREAQVLPAAVEVEAVAQQLEAHHDALAVPAGPAVAPRRRPRRLARLGQLPQHEVGGMALVLGAEHLALAAAGDELVEALVGEQPVVGHRLHGEVHAVVGDVGVRRRRPARRSSPPSGRRTRWRAGCRSGGPTLSWPIASNHTASHRSVISCHGRPSRSARSMILSSMSVMLETNRTSSPLHSR